MVSYMPKDRNITALYPLFMDQDETWNAYTGGYYKGSRVVLNSHQRFYQQEKYNTDTGFKTNDANLIKFLTDNNTSATFVRAQISYDLHKEAIDLFVDHQFSKTVNICSGSNSKDIVDCLMNYDVIFLG
jgi:hypothetical protein